MKRHAVITSLILLALACSLADVPGLMPEATLPPPTEPPTQTSLPTETPTITPTQLTPTFTATPTPLGWQPTPTEAPTETPGAVTSTALALPPLEEVITNTPKYSGFLTVFLQSNVIFWGACSPNSTLITTTVENPAKVDGVILFLRLKDKKFEDETKWRGVAMDKQDGGLYTYTLHYKNLNDYGHFTHAWVLYQLVAVNKKGEPIGRTVVYDNRLSLEACP